MINYIAAGLTAIAVALGVWLYIERAHRAADAATIEAKNTAIGDLTGKLKTAAAVLKTNADAITDYRKQVVDMNATLAEFARDDRRRADRTLRELESIAHAPASDDGPIAPVLRAQFDRMRDRSAAPDRVDGNPGSRTPADSP